jgi:hypothetical protein
VDCLSAGPFIHTTLVLSLGPCIAAAEMARSTGRVFAWLLFLALVRLEKLFAPITCMLTGTNTVSERRQILCPRDRAPFNDYVGGQQVLLSQQTRLNPQRSAKQEQRIQASEFRCLIPLLSGPGALLAPPLTLTAARENLLPRSSNRVFPVSGRKDIRQRKWDNLPPGLPSLYTQALTSNPTHTTATWWAFGMQPIRTAYKNC